MLLYYLRVQLVLPRNYMLYSSDFPRRKLLLDAYAYKSKNIFCDTCDIMQSHYLWTSAYSPTIAAGFSSC